MSISGRTLVERLLLPQRSDQREFELDGLSPEAITASQRACEVWIRD